MNESDKDSLGVMMTLMALPTGFVGIPLFLGTGQPVLVIISIALLFFSQFLIEDGAFNCNARARGDNRSMEEKANA